jgi:hypothetical protein
MADPCRWASHQASRVGCRRPGDQAWGVHGFAPAVPLPECPWGTDPILAERTTCLDPSVERRIDQRRRHRRERWTGAQGVGDPARARVEGRMTRGRARWFPVG